MIPVINYLLDPSFETSLRMNHHLRSASLNGSSKKVSHTLNLKEARTCVRKSPVDVMVHFDDGRRYALEFRRESRADMFVTRVEHIMALERQNIPGNEECIVTEIDINPETNPLVAEVVEVPALKTPKAIKLAHISKVEYEGIRQLAIHRNHDLPWPVVLDFTSVAGADKFVEQILLIIRGNAQARERADFDDPTPEPDPTPEEVAVDDQEEIPVITTSRLSTAKILDVDSATNPLIKRVWRWDQGSTVVHQLMLSQVVGWGRPTQSTLAQVEGCACYFSILLSSGYSVVLGFATDAHKALFEEEFLLKLNAL